jgi:hypothetical protein
MVGGLCFTPGGFNYYWSELVSLMAFALQESKVSCFGHCFVKSIIFIDRRDMLNESEFLLKFTETGILQN